MSMAVFQQTFYIETGNENFLGGTVARNLPAIVGDRSSTPGPGRFHMPQSK